jgi:hypothetical protein
MAKVFRMIFTSRGLIKTKGVRDGIRELPFVIFASSAVDFALT